MKLKSAIKGSLAALVLLGAASNANAFQVCGKVTTGSANLYAWASGIGQVQGDYPNGLHCWGVNIPYGTQVHFRCGNSQQYQGPMTGDMTLHC